MKRLLVLSVLLLVSSEVLAMDKVYHDLLDADVRAKKAAVVVKLLKLSDADTAIFNPIFQEYQRELDRVSDTRAILIQEYAVVSPTMSLEMAELMLDQFFELEEKELEIRQKHMEKLGEKLGPVVAVNFYHLDTKLNLFVNLQTASKLPLVRKSAVTGQ